MTDIYFMDTFAGMGGLRIGVEKALIARGYNPICVKTSEIKSAALTTLRTIYPEEDFEYTDITKVDTSELPHIDGLIGGFPCFTGDTLILTKEGYKPIKDIQVGDEVLTHKKRYRKVLNVFDQGVKDTILLRTSFDGGGLTTTSNHKFYVRKKIKTYSDTDRYESGRKRVLRGFEDPEWVEAKDLTKDHYVGVPINNLAQYPEWESYSEKSTVIKDNVRNNSFWWVMGRYMADGWVRPYRRGYPSGIVICLGKQKDPTEFEYHLNNLVDVNYTKSEEETVVKYHITRKELGMYVLQFGRGAHNKRLTGDILNLPKEALKYFIEGYFSGDGHKQNDGTSFQFTSVSKELLIGIGQCIGKVYERPYRIRKNKMPATTVIEGRTVNQRDFYVLQSRSEGVETLNFYEDGYLWGNIMDITDAGAERVYDIEVDEDHSFTAHNIMAHNCQSFSYAGKRKGLEDTRGTLFYELARIMKEKQPQWAIFENVKGLLTHDGGQTFETILHTFYSLGYHVSFQVMDAKHYGVANSRPRVFIVCHRETEIQMRIPVQQTIPFSTIKQTLPVEDSEYTRKLLAKYTPDYLRGKKVTDKAKSKNIIHTWEFEARGPVNGTQVKIMEHLRDQYINGKRGSKGSNYEVLASHFGDIKDDIDDLLEKRYIQYKEAEDEYRVLAGELSGQFTRFVDPRKPLPTLVATSLPHMGVVEEGGIRQVSLYEATRALGFPDDYQLPDTISETWAYDLLGNTVAPPVVTLIMEEIIKQSEVITPVILSEEESSE